MNRLAGEELDDEVLRRALARGLARPAFRIVVVQRQRLKADVLRLSLEVDGAPRSVIAKRLAPEIAVRNRMAVERWLPACGMADVAAPLLAVLAEPDATWLVQQDLGRHTLESAADDASRVGAAIELVARLHRRFAGHALLAECRLWGGDLGAPFLLANLRDAERAVAALRQRLAAERDGRVELCERLLARLARLREDAPERARELERLGGPETLLHGDLWLANVVETTGGAKLIDWDHAGVGPPVYDVSTFLMRLAPGARRAAWSAYRDALGASAWEFPDERALARLAQSCEIARIATRLVWPSLEALRGDAPSEHALEQLAEVETWFDAMTPLFP